MNDLKRYKYTPLQLIVIYFNAVFFGVFLVLLASSNQNFIFALIGFLFTGVISLFTAKSMLEVISLSKK
ncbi:hypothetical protein [uncultured Croceitalea sp.]|uniref:hypothetical protein n=1 Tax=uncultured Croceitalea sp. TaxID=1798908 RepID=UPI003305F164